MLLNSHENQVGNCLLVWQTATVWVLCCIWLFRGGLVDVTAVTESLMNIPIGLFWLPLSSSALFLSLCCKNPFGSVSPYLLLSHPLCLHLACILIAFLCQLDMTQSHFGSRNLSWEKVPVRLTSDAFSWLAIDGEGPSSLWRVSALG